MEIDIRTLVLLIGIMHIIQVGVLLHQFLVNKTFRGIECWLAWNVAEILGFTFMLLRGAPSFRLPAIIGQNFFIIGGVLFLYVGIRRFFGLRNNWNLSGAIFAAFAAAFLYFLFADNDLRTRGLIISATVSIVAFLSAWTLLAHRTRAVAATAIFLAATFLAHGGLHLGRAAWIVAGGDILNFYSRAPINIAMYLDAIIVGTVWTFGLIIMINQRLNADISEAKMEMELAFNTSPDATVITRLADGVIAYVNDGFTALTGYTAREAVGKSVLDLRIWNKPEDRQRVIADLRRKGLCENFEATFQRKDGTQLTGLMAAKLLDLQFTPHIISVTHDITARKQAEETLRQTKAALEEAYGKLQASFELESRLTAQARAASDAKSQFLANISHEIRTPMNGIIGVCELLLETKLDGEQLEYTRIINSSADALLNIINATLDFSKIEAGKLELEQLDFNLRDIVEDITAVLAVNAAKARLELVVSIEPDVPLDLNGDPGRLRQVLFNLVGNAIKFTPAGEIAVRVERAEREGAGFGPREARGKVQGLPCVAQASAGDEASSGIVAGQPESRTPNPDPFPSPVLLRFSVSDTGIGIPPEKLPLLFQSFSQADASLSRKFGGTGLGLAISKGLAEKMGGTIEVESRPGQGSTFRFTIPFARQQRKIASDAKLHQQPLAPAGKKLHILVAEDNMTNQKVILGILKNMGHAAVAVADGREAVKALELTPYDLVLMDIQMPEMDGLEATRRIRAMEAQRAEGREDQKSEIRGQRPECPAPPAPSTLLRLPSPERSARAGPGASSVVPRCMTMEDKTEGMPSTMNHQPSTIPPRPGPTPILALTAHALPEDREKCHNAGMNGFITKPVTSQSIAAAIAPIAFSAQGPGAEDKTSAADEPAAPPQLQPTGTDTAFNSRSLSDRLSGDTALMRDVINTFLSDTPEYLGELETAVRTHQQDSASRVAHALKGSAANVGADQLAAGAAAIETACRANDWRQAGELLPGLRRQWDRLARAMREQRPAGP